MNCIDIKEVGSDPDLYVRLSVFLLSVGMSIYLSFLSVFHLSMYMSMHLLIHLSIHLSIYLPIYLSTYQSIYLSTYQSIYLSIYLYQFYSHLLSFKIPLNESTYNYLI